MSRALVSTLISTLLFVLAMQNSVFAEETPTYDKYLSSLPYPFEVKKFTVSSQGKSLNMAYMFLKPKSGYPVVTLFHGKNFNASYWEQTANMLHKLGYGVLMPDQIGFGKSAKPTDYQYSFAALANNTRALMQSLNIDKSMVVGHSMGGMLATRFTLLFPHMANNLVLINPIGLENYLLYERYTDIERLYQSELKKRPEMIKNYQQKNYYDNQWNSQFAKHAEFLQGWINGPDWPQMARISALTYDMLLTQPVIEEFTYLSVPTTLILGTRDRTAPGRAHKRNGVERQLGRYDQLGSEVKQRNGNIDVVELDELGHLPHIEDFNRFKAPFLKALQVSK